MLTTLITFSGLIGAGFSLDAAAVVFHCDNIGTPSISRDGGSTIDESFSSFDEWRIASEFEVSDVTCDTVVFVDCYDKLGGHGGFIANVDYNGQDYYTTNGLGNGNWELVSSSDNVVSPLLYTPKTDLWPITTAAINSNAYWVWNGNNYNTMVFKFDFANIFEDCCDCCDKCCIDPAESLSDACWPLPIAGQYHYPSCADKNHFIQCGPHGPPYAQGWERPVADGTCWDACSNVMQHTSDPACDKPSQPSRVSQC